MKKLASPLAESMRAAVLGRVQSELESAFMPEHVPPPVNASAFPDSPADGVTVDRLCSILADAKDGNADDLLALYADIVSRDADFIAGGLQRKSALVAREPNITVPKGAGDLQRANRDWLRTVWPKVKGKRRAIAHHLDATFWPVAIVEKCWQRAPYGSGRYYDLAELREVPFWRITFAADDNGPSGVLKIRDLLPDGSLAHTTHLPTPMRYSIHRGHLLQALPDCWGGPMRAVVFWWYFGNWARAACAQHLEACNLPKWVAKYPMADADVIRRELARAFQRAVVTSALIIPEDAKLEAIATLNSDGVQAFIGFMEVCQKQIAKVVAAQTMTLNASPQGIGGSQASVQDDALDDVQEFDAAMLAETWQETILQPILDLNARPGDCPLLSWGADSEEAAVQASTLTDLHSAGLRVRADGLDKLSEIYGLPLEYVPAPTAMAGFSADPASSIPPHMAAADEIADAVAEDFADAFSADSAGISRALREAKTPAELLTLARRATAGFSPHRSARLMEDLLCAAAANGILGS